MKAAASLHPSTGKIGPCWGPRWLPHSNLLLIALSIVALPALETEPQQHYRARRDALAARLTDGVTVVFASTEPRGADAMYGFRQNPNYFYLTGIAEPDGIVMLLPRARKGPREILFLPDRNAAQEKWTGPKLSPESAGVAAHTGFEAVMSTGDFERELKRALPAHRDIYTVLPRSSDPEAGVFERVRADRLKKLAPSADIGDAAAEIARLRQVKSPAELALMEKAIRASMEAHREALGAVRPGMYEYELAALMKYTFERQGCERPAYSPIVASGSNATILHYSRNDRRMEAGDLVVIDVGGEYSGYTADITRTLPVSGKFTARQREIYEIVLGAQKAAIAAVKPGMNIGRVGDRSIHRVAYDYINTHGKDRHRRPLGQYFIHGTNHFLGLDVHDVGDLSRPLEAGMVITVEPGIYIPEENIGIRIEDILLVTDSGAKNLTANLPREADEIERAIARR